MNLRERSDAALQQVFIELLCDGDFQARRIAETGFQQASKEYGTINELMNYTIQKETND